MKQPFLVEHPVGQPGQAVVEGQEADLVHHARIGEGHGNLIGDPAHLDEIVLGGLALLPPKRQNSEHLPAVAERKGVHGAPAAVALEMGEERRQRRQAIAVHQPVGMLPGQPEIFRPDLGRLLTGLGAVGPAAPGGGVGAIALRQQGDADPVAGADQGNPVHHRVGDGPGVHRGEHRAVDFRRGLESAELPGQAGGHQVERAGQLLQLIAAVHLDPMGKIPLGDAPGAALELRERKQAPPDLGHAQDHDDQERHRQQQRDVTLEGGHRGEDIGPGLAQDHPPGWEGEGALSRGGFPAGQNLAPVAPPFEIAAAVPAEGLRGGWSHLGPSRRGGDQDTGRGIPEGKRDRGGQRLVVGGTPEVTRVDAGEQERLAGYTLPAMHQVEPHGVGAGAPSQHRARPGCQRRKIRRRGQSDLVRFSRKKAEGLLGENPHFVGGIKQPVGAIAASGEPWGGFSKIRFQELESPEQRLAGRSRNRGEAFQALAGELAGRAPIREPGDGTGRHHGANREEEEQTVPEPATQVEAGCQRGQPSGSFRRLRHQIPGSGWPGTVPGRTSNQQRPGQPGQGWLCRGRARSSD
jgi:hypothetical protein